MYEWRSSTWTPEDSSGLSKWTIVKQQRGHSPCWRVYTLVRPGEEGLTPHGHRGPQSCHLSSRKSRFKWKLRLFKAAHRSLQNSSVTPCKISDPLHGQWAQTRGYRVNAVGRSGSAWHFEAPPVSIHNASVPGVQQAATAKRFLWPSSQWYALEYLTASAAFFIQVTCDMMQSHKTTRRGRQDPSCQPRLSLFYIIYK